MKVMVTGGRGFIGSSVVSECAAAGMDLVVLDRRPPRDGETACGDGFVGDVADGGVLDRVFAAHPDIDVLIHMAALSSISAAVADPLRCYEDNVAATAVLMRRATDAGIRRVIFSSSITVGSSSASRAVDSAVRAGPYAMSKLMGEQIIHDASVSGAFHGLVLRYANLIGVQDATRLPGDPRIRRNVLDLIVDAAHRGVPFTITGTGWPTPDGSAERDFVHVRDVARAHRAALERFDDILTDRAPFRVLEIGTGVATSVRQLVGAVEAVRGRAISVQEGEARPGDVSGRTADIADAMRLLGWRPTQSLHDSVLDVIAAREMR